MAKSLCRLRRLLRRAQLLILLLSVVYIMAGSILLLQRSAAPVSQRVGTPIQSLSAPSRAPPNAHWAPGAGWHHGGSGFRRPQDTDANERSGRNAGQVLARVTSWNRNLDRRRLRRHWFNSQVTQGELLVPSGAPHRPVRHKGTYMGCFIDDARTRALGGTVLYNFRKMTTTLCQDTCSNSGYQYAGLEYGAECHCGNRIAGPQTRLVECNLDCKGEKGAACGGVERLSVYKLDKKLPGQRRYSSLHYRGCFKKPDNATGAFLIHSTDSDSTLEACIEACTEKEFPLAALRGLSCLCVHAGSGLTTQWHSPVEESMCLSGNHTISSPTGSPTSPPTGSPTSPPTGSPTSSPTSSPTGPSQHLEYYQVYYTPALDARCKERTFLSETSTSLVALSSFPGAGNTWVRHLIELSTGYYTGSVYFDGALFTGGFKGEKDHWKKGRTICVKTHESGQREIEMFDEGILLLRNPYHSLVAEFNRKCGGHVGYASDRHWKSKDWPEFVESHASWWVSHALAWLKFSCRLLVMHFEELQADLVSQLQLITSFLNARVTEDRLLCAESNRDGLFKRSGPRRPTFDPYTPAMRELIDGYILTVDQALRDRNFSGLPLEYMPR